MRSSSLGQISVNTAAVQYPAGEHTRAGGRTDRSRRVAVGEAHTLRRESIQPGRLNYRVPITGMGKAI